MNIKAFTAAALLATAATTASAGGLMDEIVEAPVQDPVPVAQPAGSSRYLLPLALIAVLIAVAAGDSGGGS